MKNLIQKGEIVTATAPYALSSGQGVKAGSLFGIVATDAAIGGSIEVARKGVFDITALTTDSGQQGAKVYWDDTARRITTTASGNTLVGCLAAPKTSADASARVLLDGAIR
jgi:predicted RecA/RadA family phage recombinase